MISSSSSPSSSDSCRHSPREKRTFTGPALCCSFVQTNALLEYFELLLLYSWTSHFFCLWPCWPACCQILVESALYSGCVGFKPGPQCFVRLEASLNLDCLVESYWACLSIGNSHVITQSYLDSPAGNWWASQWSSDTHHGRRFHPNPHEPPEPRLSRCFQILLWWQSPLPWYLPHLLGSALLCSRIWTRAEFNSS